MPILRASSFSFLFFFLFTCSRIRCLRGLWLNYILTPCVLCCVCIAGGRRTSTAARAWRSKGRRTRCRRWRTATSCAKGGTSPARSASTSSPPADTSSISTSTASSTSHSHSPLLASQCVPKLAMRKSYGTRWLLHEWTKHTSCK